MEYHPTPSVLTQVGLQTGLDVVVPLLKPLKHAPKELTLILEASGQVVHVGIGWLALEPYLGVCSAVMEIHTHRVKALQAFCQQEEDTDRMTCSILQQ